MGLIPDAIVNLVCLIAFAVYAVMGLAFFVTGIVYMGDAGAIGATGMYLIFLGLIMLIVGGIALWATQNDQWLVLFVIELFNVALFLFLYVLIVIVLMMATGTTDPVREATVETWDNVLPGLTLPGSNPDGDGSAATGTYCEKQTEGDACVNYYTNAAAAPFLTTDACAFTEPRTTMQALNNCTLLFSPPPGYLNTGVNSGCGGTLYTQCMACETACKEAQISDVKENLEPASVFVLGLMVFLIIDIVWNNIMIDQEDIGALACTVGYILNGALLGLSFIMIIMGGMGAAKAADACPGAADCVPASMTMLVLIGVCTMVVAGVILFGIKENNNMLIGIMTIVLIFLAILMVLFALILGMSTGVVMDDMTYYYDTQYPKLRSALEKADNSYCRMSKVQCMAMAQAKTSADVQSGDPLVKITCDTGDPICIDEMPYDSVWKAMHAAASVEANMASAPAWIADCKTTALCIYCGDLYYRAPALSLGVHDASSVNSLAGTPCGASCSTAGTFGAHVGCSSSAIGTDGCISRANSFNWVDALSGSQNATSTIGTSSWTSGSYETGVTGWSDHKAPVTTTIGASNLNGGAVQVAGTGGLKCMGEVVDYGAAYYNAPSDVMHNGECIAPVSVDTASANYNKRCAGDTGANAAGTVTALPAGALTCTTGGVLEITTADVWTGMIENITRFDILAKEAMPYCEEAIIDYSQQEANCKTFSNQNPTQQNSFYANCEQCSDPFAPFTFNLPGPDVEYRQCLNFFVGHMGQCSATEASCQDVFLTTASTGANSASTVNSQFMVDKAFGDAKSGFCGYSDRGCKSKIKFDIESSMSKIGVMGAIFLSFFLVIIYCTLCQIQAIRGGDDDDDDDE